MARLNLRLLGDFEARLGAGSPLRLRTRKTEALLAYLALPSGATHSRDKLASLLWGERSQAEARSRLRGSLFVLRRALAAADPPCLAIGSEAVALDFSAVDVDVTAFARLLEAGDPEALARAGELYRGDLLEGFAFRGALFEDWLMGERERLRELALDAWAKLLAHQRAAGAAEAAVQTALRLLALDPLQEPVHRTLMRLYAQLGRRGAALRHYQLCVGVLKRELGVEPEADTRQLYGEILRQRPRRAPVAGATRGGLGEERVPPPSWMTATSMPLIGREGEVTALRHALGQARAGAGRLVAIVGEAGAGKTRLIAEIATEALPLDFRVLVGRCYESDQILPFGSWVDALRTSRVTVEGALLDELGPPWRSELTRLLPEVAVPGLPEPADNPLRLFESVARLLDRLAGERPVLLVLEDLHWADEMTLRLLAFVTRRIPPWPILLIVTARAEELADAAAVHGVFQELGTHAHAEQLTLLPLSRPDTARLTRMLVRAGSDTQAVVRLEDQVWAASEGNPFVAVETTRALQDGTIPPDARTLPLPQRVRELLASRLERLSDAARELAALAAVIGREFEFPLLQQASGLGEPAAAAGVEELVRRHVLRGVGEGFDFSHDRIRAVVYDKLLPPRRKLIHRRVGEALEALYAGNLEPHYLALGTHFREGEVWEKATSHLWRAGTRAAVRSAYREAVACFEQALAALGHAPETRETLAQAIDLHLEARRALYPLGDIEAIFGHLQTAEAVAVTLGDQRRLADVLANLTQYFWQVGELREGLETGQRAVAIAEALDDFGLRVAADQYLGQVYLDRGAYREAAVIFGHHAGELGDDRIRQHFGMAGYPAVFYRFLLGYCHAELGEFVDGIALGEKARYIAEEIDQPYVRALSCLWLGRIHLVKGEFVRASQVLEAGVDIAEARQLGSPVLVAALGYAQAMSGQLSSGLPRLQTGEAGLRGSRSHGRLALVSAWLGDAYLMAGRSAAATDTAQRALALARHHHQRSVEAWTLRLLGEIAAQASPRGTARAEESYRQALALAEELTMRPLAACCYLGLGRLYRQAAQRSAAEEHLTTAQAMLAEMEMHFWLEQAEGELALLV